MSRHLERLGRTLPFARMTAISLAALALVALAACAAEDTAGPSEVLAVTILDGPRTVEVGDEITLEMEVDVAGDASTAVTWSTSDASVATVDDEGRVSGLSPGDVTVRATSVADESRFDEVVVTVSDETEPQGVRLEGEPNDPALDATYDLSVPMAPGPDDVSVVEDTDGETYRVLRSELELHLDPRATVGEVNDLLERYEAWIVDMLAGRLALVVSVPDPGSLPDLEALADELEEDPLVRFVLTGYEVEPDSRGTFGRGAEAHDGAPTAEVLALPDGLSGQLSRVEHHLAVRAHAAWNLRPMLPGTTAVGPRLVVGDLFGDGPVDDAYDVVITPGDFAEDRPDSHGYHVLGIVSGAFHENAVSDTARDRITGIYPSVLRTRVVDLREWRVPTISRVSNGLIRHIETLHDHDPDRGIVVNTSLHHRKHPLRNRGARSWVAKVRGGSDHATSVGAGLENHFVHITSAGNVPDRDAVDNSAWTVAALGTMITFTGTEIPNLTNMLVVENRVNTRHGDDHPDLSGEAARPLPGCAWRGGTLGGDISGIGRSVWSFGFRDSDGDHDTTTPGTKTGTSMAAPQVAGVAAMVWAVDPGLSGPQVAELLRATSTPASTNTLHRDAPDDCAGETPQPVVDAYAAMMAAAGDDGRLALLDATGDGTFQHGDIEAILAGFSDEGSGLSYGRFDLSGDGRSGSWTRTERFDLSGDLDHGNVGQEVVTLDGSSLVTDFDEEAVNDHDVLCYYAYSDLYSGDEDERNALLGDLCSGRPTVVITSPEEGDTVTATSGVTFVAEMAPSRPGGTLPDLDHLYSIDWSYRLEDGTRVELGASAPGEALVADMVCSEAQVSATATHRDTQYLSRDRVGFTYDSFDPDSFTWQTAISGSGVATHSYLPMQDGSLDLHGSAERLRCAGVEEAHTNRLLWAIEGSGAAPQRGSSFTVQWSDLEEDASGSIYVELWHEDSPADSRTRHEVVPCTRLTGPDGQALAGTRACPAPGEPSKIQEALGRIYGEVADAQLAAWMLERELGLLFPFGAPVPFPNTPEQLDESLPEVFGGTRLWFLAAGHIESLRDLLSSYEEGELEGSLRSEVLELDVSTTEQMATLAPDLLEFALTTSLVAVSTYAAFEPAEDGGGGAWRWFPVTSDADGTISPPVSGAVPALAATDGFLTGVVATHSAGELDLEVAYEAAAIASAEAALESTD